MFASDLERYLNGGPVDCGRIARWAYAIRLTHLKAIDADVSDWLLRLGAMDMGSEYEWSEDELRALVAKARGY
jgi:hypothetical protein